MCSLGAILHAYTVGLVFPKSDSVGASRSPVMCFLSAVPSAGIGVCHSQDATVACGIALRKTCVSGGSCNFLQYADRGLARTALPCNWHMCAMIIGPQTQSAAVAAGAAAFLSFLSTRYAQGSICPRITAAGQRDCITSIQPPGLMKMRLMRR